MGLPGIKEVVLDQSLTRKLGGRKSRGGLRSGCRLCVKPANGSKNNEGDCQPEHREPLSWKLTEPIAS